MRDFTEKQIEYIKDRIYDNTIFPISILDVHDDGSFNEDIALRVMEKYM